ncbi:MAG: alpha/beta hydrolase [Chthoniobacter sp.]
MKFVFPILLASLAVLFPIHADEPGLPKGCSVRRDVVYATRDPGGPQKLDLYLPAGKGPHPWVLRIHGGAWRAGDKTQGVPTYLLEAGYAIASVEHRFTSVAPFPAQIQDVKAALRYLREHAAEFDLDPQRVAAMGDSSGSHLACLVGLTSGVPAFTDDPASKTNDRVLAVVDFYAPSDLRTIPEDWQKTNHPDLIDAVDRLLGGSKEERLARGKSGKPDRLRQQDITTVLDFAGRQGRHRAAEPEHQSRSCIESSRRLERAGSASGLGSWR